MSTNVAFHTLSQSQSTPVVCSTNESTKKHHLTVCPQLLEKRCARVRYDQGMHGPKSDLIAELVKKEFVVYENGTAWCWGHGGFVPIEALDGDHFEPKKTVTSTIDYKNATTAKEEKALLRKVDDMANRWLLCNACNGSGGKSDQSPTGWLAGRPDFGQKFLDTISHSEGITTFLKKKKLTEGCIIGYKDKEWVVTSVTESDIRTKIEAESGKEIPIVIGVWSNDKIAICPKSEERWLNSVYKNVTTSSAAAASPVLKNRKFEYTGTDAQKTKHLLDIDISQGEITERTAAGIEFMFCQEQGIQGNTIENPDNSIIVRTYYRTHDGILCAPDGIKLGKKAVEYYLENHERKMTQKREAEKDVFHPLESEIDEVNLAKYKKKRIQRGDSKVSVDRALSAIDKKMTLLKRAIEDTSLCLSSDSDTDLNAEDKKEVEKSKNQAFEHACTAAFAILKSTYKTGKPPRKKLSAAQMASATAPIKK